jgi:hypothetical protein
MCAVDDAEPWDFCHSSNPRAAKQHICCECRRTIRRGETHHYLSGVYDGHWSSYRWCHHCQAAGRWMQTVCGGHLLGDLLAEMREHWYEGYRSVEFGRLIASVKLGWHDGRDEIPDTAQVHELAMRMMRQAVAA